MKIAVVIPTINVERAKLTLSQLKSRDGFDSDDVGYFSVEDKQRTGFVRTFANALQNIDAEYFVYAAEDAYADRNWLLIAYHTLEITGFNLFGFNDGKYYGQLASFGMGRASFLKQHWCTEYKDHFVDTEITQIAKRDNTYCSDLKSILIEVDYHKGEVNQYDKTTYNRRKHILFRDYPKLMSEFS